MLQPVIVQVLRLAGHGKRNHSLGQVRLVQKYLKPASARLNRDFVAVRLRRLRLEPGALQ